MEEKILKFLEDIVNERNGFKFGEIIRIKDTNLFVLPIIYENGFDEEYLLAEEARLDIIDTGRIGEIIVSNLENKPVLIRPATILCGASTQSRGVSFGIIILEGEREILNTRCVHASHPIRTGERFRAMFSAPKEVKYALIADLGQEYVWHSVGHYMLDMKISERDNLVKKITIAKESLKKYVEDIPICKNQVGAAIFHKNELIAMEILIPEDKWKIVYKDFVLKNIHPYLKEEGIYDVKKEEIVEKLKTIIKSVEIKHLRKTTYKLFGKIDSKEIVGQVILLKDFPINIVLDISEIYSNKCEISSERYIREDVRELINHLRRILRERIRENRDISR